MNRLAMNRSCVFRFAPLLLAAALCFGLFAGPARSAETPTPIPKTVEDTNSQEVLRAYLQLQEQLHATQLAIERSRQEGELAAARTAEAMGARLQAIEQAVALQRAQELEAMQSANRALLIVAGTFAGIGFLAMLFTAYFQWRAMNRLAEISAGVSAGRGLAPPPPPLPALGPGETHSVTVAPADASNSRLLGAIERLEKRILELEQTARPPLSEGTSAGGNSKPWPAVHDMADASNEASTNNPAQDGFARVTLLLAKGQSLLNLDRPEEAMVCFDEVLQWDANNSDALVKKGVALERLRKLNEAIECYDRAIAADNSMTIAYLHKGGLYNRMERFSEALECYEQALRTQEQAKAVRELSR